MRITEEATSGKGVNGAKLRGIYGWADDKLQIAVSPRKIAHYIAKKTMVKTTVAKATVKTTILGVLSGMANKGAFKVIGYLK